MPVQLLSKVWSCKHCIFSEQLNDSSLSSSMFAFKDFACFLALFACILQRPVPLSHCASIGGEAGWKHLRAKRNSFPKQLCSFGFLTFSLDFANLEGRQRWESGSSLNGSSISSSCRNGNAHGRRSSVLLQSSLERYQQSDVMGYMYCTDSSIEVQRLGTRSQLIFLGRSWKDLILVHTLVNLG